MAGSYGSDTGGFKQRVQCELSAFTVTPFAVYY